MLGGAGRLVEPVRKMLHDLGADHALLVGTFRVARRKREAQVAGLIGQRVPKREIPMMRAASLSHRLASASLRARLRGTASVWTLAAAAYNRGIGGIQNAMKNQKAENYFDLMLNPETGAFVYRILAYKTLFSNPEFLGIAKKLRYFPKPPYKILKVDSAIADLTRFAAAHQTNLITLRCFNPWLLRNSMPNPAGKAYQIHIPKNPQADYSGYASDLIPAGDPLTPYVKQPQLAEGINHDTLLAKQVNYVVRISEPIANLARFLKVPEEDLRKWNHLEGGQNAVVGQTLVVYYKR